MQGVSPRMEDADWQDALCHRLTFRALSPTAQTLDAEVGFGFTRSSYWYVFSFNRNFSRCSVSWLLTSAPETSVEEVSISPFDTGGLWHERITAEPPFKNRGDIQEYFVETRTTVLDWIVRFNEWLKSYNDPHDYILGEPPAKEVPNSRIVFDLMVNDPRAWTWEGRVTSANVQQHCEPQHIFWNYEDSDDFHLWLENEENQLSLEDKVRLVEWMGANSSTVLDNYERIISHLIGSLDTFLGYGT